MIKKLHNRASALPKLLWLLLLAVLPAQLSATYFEYEYEGKTLLYTVINEEAKTVCVAVPFDVSGEVIIPSEVTNKTDTYSVITVQNFAFQTTSVTSVTIPNSVTTIGSHAFDHCRSLTSVAIPSSVTTIGDKAFGECSSLTSVTIPSSVTTINEGVFEGCSSLTSATIPSSVTTIDDSAFEGCSSLTSIAIPNSVTTIGSYAFARCSSLTSIAIPSSVTTIGSYAFEGCSLTSIAIPNSMTTIGSCAFAGCSSLTSIAIPSSVTTIDDSAFWGCSSLTSVAIPNSVTTIGSYAFSKCSSLTSVAIPSSVTTIDLSAFEGCSSLTSVTIPSSVTTIGDNAFSGCSSLTSIAIPNSVTTIRSHAFSECSSLTSIAIPNSVTTIDFSAFEGCSSLTSVTIPSSVTKIGDSAFEGCSSLTSVTIPSSVTKINYSAFEGCSSLTSVTFQSPSKKLVLGDAVFNDTKVTTINFEGDYTIKLGVFDPIFDCGSVKTLMFRGNYTIEESAFEGISLQILQFYGTSYIGKKAFYNSNAARIYLQDCQGIEEYAFATAQYPYSNFILWCFSEEPPYVADSNAFSGLPNGVSSDDKIFVPTNSSEEYLKAYGWDYFYKFTGMGEIKNLTFTPSEVHLDLKKSITIELSADMTGGYKITSTEWTSSDEDVVAVNTSGAIQAKASGMAMIYCTYSNNYDLSNKVKATLVTVGDVDFSLDAEAEQGTIAMGESTGVKLTYGGQGYTVESEQWATSDAEIATVDEHGVITGVAPGEATITLTVNFDNGLYATREISVKVTEESGIDDVVVNGNDAPAEFYNLNGVRVNGKALTPGLYIKRQAGKSAKVLVK